MINNVYLCTQGDKKNILIDSSIERVLKRLWDLENDESLQIRYLGQANDNFNYSLSTLINIDSISTST